MQLEIKVYKMAPLTFYSVLRGLTFYFIYLIAVIFLYFLSNSDNSAKNIYRVF